ncbi:unnamed protein product [Lymnaea stagnalis]|uniref:Uncharacterized protein n=1 Tax=Lymnaea stagnalis TaxID=6523 RepID=A0AAV2HBC4_LYMST
MGQVQVHCNNSVATNNNSMWILCLDSEFGLRFSDQEKDDKVPLIYSIGPSADYNFEYFVSKNLSSRLYIFSHLANKLSFLVKANPDSNAIFKTTIVPNDPADFARNSFETQTLNSVMVHLKHKKIDILKIDTLLESVLAHEVLHFLIEDGVLTNVKELHLVINLDKLDEDYIYSWYRVLYALFHTAGFRLYHTATSEPLCLQDTMMESCKYYLSFVQLLPPHTFVMYPPAIDGSLHNEMERVTSFLDVTFKDVQTLPVRLQLVSLSHLHQRQDELSVKIFKSVLKHHSSTHSCQITFLLDVQYNEFAYEASIENPVCDIKLFAINPLTSSSSSPRFNRLQIGSKDGVTKQTHEPEHISTIQENLSTFSTNIMYIELDDAWDLLATLSSLGIPKVKSYII